MAREGCRRRRSRDLARVRLAVGKRQLSSDPPSRRCATRPVSRPAQGDGAVRIQAPISRCLRASPSGARTYTPATARRRSLQRSTSPPARSSVRRIAGTVASRQFLRPFPEMHGQYGRPRSELGSHVEIPCTSRRLRPGSTKSSDGLTQTRIDQPDNSAIRQYLEQQQSRGSSLQTTSSQARGFVWTLAADRFTMADLLVSGSVEFMCRFGILDPSPAVKSYRDRCLARPAAARARDKEAAASSQA